MKCPSCDVSLVEKRVARILIDFCNGCQGIWFDPGELADYQSILALTDVGEPGDGEEFSPTQSSTAQNCPRCEQATLVAGSFADYDMSQCQGCRGVFVPTKTLHSFGFRSETSLLGGVADAATDQGIEALLKTIVRLISNALDGL